MAPVRYLGIPDPKKAFDALRPLHAEIIRLKSGCKPFGPDYLILEAVRTALATAAYHFTRDPDFFSGRPH